MNLAALAERNLDQFGEYRRLVFEGRAWTNRALHDRSVRLAGALAGLGVEPGDRVVVCMMNCPQVLECYAAIWRAGAVAIPVLFALEATEIEYVLRNSGAKVAVTSPELSPKLGRAAANVASCRHIVVTGDGYEALVAAAPAAAICPRDAGDAAVILYTSGTTGRPKGVVQTHGNLLAAVTNSWLSGRQQLHQRSLLALPLAHSFGLGVLVGGYLHGGEAVLLRWFDAEAALQAIAEHRVQAMAGVPTMFITMMDHPRAGAYDTSSVERWLVGGAPMPVESLRRFEQTFGGTLYVGYGLTEACPGIACEREGMPRKPGSCGVAMENVGVEIVDDQGRALPPGEPGEVRARGANISPGYYEMPDATAETFRDGWLHTGDIGYLDADGYLFIVERKKDLIIRGGFNVYPKDVEEVLCAHAAVAECAVVGVPDRVLGEQVCAFVVLRPGAAASAEELGAHCRSRLAKYKTPRWIEIASSLPRTTIGKVQKKELRRLAAERFAAG